jgi:hypothetical protein
MSTAEPGPVYIERLRRSNRRWKVLAIGSWAILGLALLFTFTSAQNQRRQAEAARQEAEAARQREEQRFNMARQALDEMYSTVTAKWIEERQKPEQPK